MFRSICLTRSSSQRKRSAVWIAESMAIHHLDLIVEHYYESLRMKMVLFEVETKNLSIK